MTDEKTNANPSWTVQRRLRGSRAFVHAVRTEAAFKKKKKAAHQAATSRHLVRKAPTCVLAGELGLGIAHPPGPLAVLLVAAVLAVLVSVTSPAFRDACPVRDAVELFCAAFDHRWQH